MGRFVPVDVPGRRVVAQRDDACALQAHDAIGLGPAAVIAQALADARAQHVSDTKAVVADLEVLLLQMLEGCIRLVVAGPGRWILR
jgi:hypothetical protein